MPNYEYLCQQCSCVTEKEYKYEERPKLISCQYCGEPAQYWISAPNVVGKASYLDGQKREGWAELKEAAKLEKHAAVEPNVATRKAIQNEIRNIKKVKK